MEEEKYFSHSWALLTRDKGWFKPLLVMSCANFVPVAGYLGNLGYALEWSRLTAWGVDASPKQKNVNIGKCISSGWRGLLVMLGLGMIVVFVSSLIGGLGVLIPGPAGAFIVLLLNIVLFGVQILYGAFINAACVRAAIYERAGAGYRVDRLFDMLKHDMSGFMKIVVVNLVCRFVTFIVVSFFGTIILMLAMPALFAYGIANDALAAVSVLAGTMVWIFLVVCIGSFVVGFFENASMLITLTATGLWFRQFDVQRWGRSEDPLPTPRPASERAYANANNARPSEAARRTEKRHMDKNTNMNEYVAQDGSQEVENRVATETTGDIFTSDYDEIRARALADVPEEASTTSLISAIDDLRSDEDMD